MNRIVILILAFVISFSSFLQAQTSYLQIKSEPNISIYIDGNFVGKTTAEYGGWIVEDISVGKHKIKIVKDGFLPQEDIVNISAGAVNTYVVKTFRPKIQITQTGEVESSTIQLKTGSIIIQSIPIEISISIPSLGINSRKTNDKWEAEDVPVGSFDAKFSYGSRTINETLYIEEGRLLHIMVNILGGNIEYLSGKNEAGPTGTIIDPRDNYEYKWVKIGNQIWFAEDMSYGPNQYRFQNSHYTWYTAQSICPEGWHLPSDEEWKELEKFIGMNDSDLDLFGRRESGQTGKKLKKSRGWWTGGEGYDTYGFHAVNGSIINPNGNKDEAMGSHFWTSTSIGNEGINREIWSGDGIYRNKKDKRYQYYVRCIKD